jgi:hypothetical protein
MNTETARNEIRNPSRITTLEMLSEAAVFVVIAAVLVQLIH